MRLFNEIFVGRSITIQRVCLILSLWIVLRAIGISAATATLQEVNRLVAAGDQKAAIVVLEAITRLEPENILARHELVKFYNWNGRGGEVIPILEELIRLEPDNLDITARLAQQYEWNNRGAEAIPLLEPLVSTQPTRPALRIRLARQLAATGQTDDAIAHLRIATKQDPKDLPAKFLLAQLCHWEICWMTAQNLYHDILQEDPKHEGAAKYAHLLRKDHGPLLTALFESSRDSNGVTRLTLGANFEYPRESTLLLTGSYLHRWFFENQVAGSERLNQDVSTLRVTRHILKSASVEGEIGGEYFDRGVGTSPVVGASIRGSLWNRVYPQLSYRYETHINRIQSIKNHIRVHRISASIYAEPWPWLATSVAVTRLYLSDDNAGTVVFSGIWLQPWRRPWLLKLGATLGYEDFEVIYADALPYYTPSEVLVVAPGFDLGYQFSERLWAEAGYSAAYTIHGGKSDNYRASIHWDHTPFDQFRASYSRSGSEVYSSDLFRFIYTHRF